MKRLALVLALLAGCAHPRVHLARVPGHFITTGTVVDITPRLVLQEMAWEHIVLVQTPDGLVTVYAGDEDPGVRPGDKVRVRGERLTEDEIAGDVDALGS